MNTDDFIGIAASVFTASTLIPQLIKIVREKSAEGTSRLMLGVLFTGLTLWVIYGIKKADAIIIAANAFSLLVNILTFLLTLRYGTKQGSRFK